MLIHWSPQMLCFGDSIRLCHRIGRKGIFIRSVVTRQSVATRISYGDTRRTLDSRLTYARGLCRHRPGRRENGVVLDVSDEEGQIRVLGRFALFPRGWFRASCGFGRRRVVDRSSSSPMWCRWSRHWRFPSEESGRSVAVVRRPDRHRPQPARFRCR